MSARVRETKERILFWLREEALSPEEIIDANAYFNFGITSGDLKLNVVQSVRLIDSLVVASKWTLGKEQQDLHKTVMDDAKRVSFFWDLQFSLLEDSQISEFQIGPNLPNDFKELLIVSNRLFYDGLTKQNLMHAILSVHKAMVRSVFLLEKHGGVLPPYPPIPRK